MAGYSSTPLVKKLGIKQGGRVAFVNAPAGFEKTLGELPPDTEPMPRPAGDMDFLLFFASGRADLIKSFPGLIKS